MKKILLATTMLVGTAGFAAAEVAVSGSARMGVIYDGSDTEFTSRIRVNFDMSGETDGGLSFGASIRADQAGVGNSGATAMNAGSVYISGAFGKLSMGDNDSAANALVGNVDGVGLTGLGDTNELGYLGQTDTSVLYTYSTGALSVALSLGQTTSADEAKSVAVSYSTDAYSVALGYEDTASNSQLSVGASATFSGVTVKAVVADRDSWANAHFALSAGYKAGALGVTAFYADHDTSEAYGIGASYDLGGGAKVVGGIVDNGTDTVADLGVSMSF